MIAALRPNKVLAFLVLGIVATFAITNVRAEGHDSEAQSCVAWEREAGGSGSAPHGRPVIDRLLPGQPFGQLVSDWMADACMRLNYVQVVGTHNSYHVKPRPALFAFIRSVDPAAAASVEYSHRPLDQQLGLLGVRHVEIDVFADPVGGSTLNRSALWFSH